MNLDNFLEIKTPPKKVWNTLIDFKTTHNWVKEKIEIIPLNKLPPRKNFRFKVYVYRPLITLKYLGEILEFDPYKKMEVLLKGGISKDSDMTIQFHLSDLNKKTKFNYKIKMEEKGLMSLVSPFSDSLGAMGADKYFTNFKELVEKT
jgi:carbon monoxide dehydrogenase subunit G